MRYRKVTNDFDYSFGNNEVDYLDGSLALAQAVRGKILLFYQEWWEDLSQGIPMFQNIIGQVSQENLEIALQNLLTKRILEFDVIKSVEFSDITIQGRNLSLVVTCHLRSGESIDVEINS